MSSPSADALAQRVRDEIVAEMHSAMSTFVTKDWRRLSEGFTQDATWVLPDGAKFQGRPAIAAHARSLYESYDSAEVGPFRIDAFVVVSETEAVVYSTMTFALLREGVKPEIHRDPAANHWKKEADGVWRIAYELNSYGGEVGELALD